MVAVVVVDSACEVLTVGLRKLGLLIQQTEYSTRSGLYQVDAVLVVHEAHILHPESLLLVQFLLVFEDPLLREGNQLTIKQHKPQTDLIEELLEFLIAVVDTELLKAVDCKIFKARDIENSNIVSRGLERNTLVDPEYFF